MAANSKPRPRIVIVEDDPGMKQAIERLLKAAGFQTSVFHSGESVLEANSPKDADCFVLDIELPGASGFNLWSQLVQSGVRSPVVFLTAFNDADAAHKAARFGAAGYLTKTFSWAKSGLSHFIRNANGAA